MGLTYREGAISYDMANGWWLKTITIYKTKIRSVNGDGYMFVAIFLMRLCIAMQLNKPLMQHQNIMPQPLAIS